MEFTVGENDPRGSTEDVFLRAADDDDDKRGRRHENRGRDDDSRKRLRAGGVSDVDPRQYIEYQSADFPAMSRKIDIRRLPYMGVNDTMSLVDVVRVTGSRIADAVRMLSGRRLRVGIISGMGAGGVARDEKPGSVRSVFSFEKNLYGCSDICGALVDMFPLSRHEVVLTSGVGIHPHHGGGNGVRLVDVITIGMTTRPAIGVNGSYAMPDEGELLRVQFIAALNLARTEGLTGLIIAPLGCEYHLHPLYTVAALMRSVLQLYAGYFRMVLIMARSDVETGFQEIFLPG